MISARHQVIFTALAACGCWPDPLLRMKDQPKVDAYEEEPRRLPAGTVPRERPLRSFEVMHGAWPDGGHLDEIPLPVTRELLEHGRRRFDTICATCHGFAGDGESIVGRSMVLRSPPSLHQYRHEPDGFFFSVITNGYGLMPSFAADIPVEERWAVVAYVRALQLSQAAPLESAPPEVREKLEAGQ